MHSDPYPNGGHIFLKASFAIFGEAGPLPVTLTHGMFGQGQIPKLFCVQPRKCLQFLGKHVLLFTTTYLDSLVLLCTSRPPVARGLFWALGVGQKLEQAACSCHRNNVFQENCVQFQGTSWAMWISSCQGKGTEILYLLSRLQFTAT